MQLLVLVGLVGLAAAQSSSCCNASGATLSTSTIPSSESSTTVVSSSTVVSTSAIGPVSTTGSTTFSSTSSAPGSAITVATDNSGQYTAINAAINAAQNSGIATVSVLQGTYSEAITVLGTATVTVVGATATSAADWSANQVTIVNSSVPFSVGTSSTQGITLKNINFVSTAAAANAVVISLRGANIAFYGCSIVSPGATAISSSFGFAFFANSYIEGSDKLFYNVPNIYVFKSTIVPLASGASIIYNKGASLSSAFYNSTVVFDSSSVKQKAGYTNSGVYLAAPNNAGAVAIYRGTALGSLIAPAGIHNLAATISSFYGEFQNTGPGSYAQNLGSRPSYDVALTVDQVSQFTIDKIFGNAPYGSPSVDWVDRDVLSTLQGSDTAQIALALSSSSSSSTVSSTTTTATGSTTTTASNTTTSTAPTSSCSPLVASGSLTVSKNPGPCDYGNITSAINAIPNDSKPYTIRIGAGVYEEQLSISRNGKVTLIGATNFTNDYTQNAVRIQFANGQLTSAGRNEETPVLNAKKANDNSGMAIYNIDFVNTYPQTPNTAALAADFYGANIAAYGCSFIGFQDTLLANKGTQVFSNCYIEGSVDFIWGFSTAYFYQCMIVTNTPGSCIAAQSRPAANAVGGYVFDSCMVTYSSAYGSSFGLSYLGRPYSQYSIAVYMNSYIDKHIKDAGWSVWSTSNPQISNVMLAEFNNSGPGSWQLSTQRASFATNLTADQAAQFQLKSWIGDTSFLDMAAYSAVPSYNLTGPSSGSLPGNPSSGSTDSATVNAHPESGSVPPFGAIIVSLDGSHNATFKNLTIALASLPNDATNQTIFLYPGTYNEQIPPINRQGPVRIIGYTTGNPGQSYKDNQVTIAYSRGLSVSPLPVGHSDAETATLSTGSNRISLYNVNMINTDNLDGSVPSYVTLAASIYGNDIAFYGCSFDGWQDTLLTGATAGYQYYESCYIGGAIDFIWGYSKAYFKGCTIGAKRKSSAMTAQSRSSSTAIGGYVFDQCLFTTAPGVADDLTNKVYLGRPYSAYALVVVKNSYIDSIISPSGWKNWSASDPRTDHITFAEYNNSGPSNWENNAAARQVAGYATLLTSDSYSLSTVMDSTEWIDMTYWNSIMTPVPSVVIPAPTNTTVTGNSTFDGTTPPVGALIVSKSPIEGVATYPTIQDALNAAPTTSAKNATLFIYPGVYNEQLIVNKPGHTIFLGYSNATDDYSQNQVTIQFNHGIDTQGTSGSNTDGATVYATGNYFHAYNINFRNYYGTQQNIASLGFAVKSSKFAGLYGCQIYGNQDTLSISGNLFTFKTYIEGNVDFIYGSGSAYFLDSTISPNEDGISITADKRATNTSLGGMVFDQCTVKPAPGSGHFTNVALGRPWNSNARVAFVDSYLDPMISPVGWNVWSKSSPNTENVLFGEYRNYGPGSSNCNRASFSQQISDADVVQFQLGNFFPSTSFIDFRRVDTQPFSPGIGNAQACTSQTLTSSSLSTSTTSSTSTSTLPVVTAYTTVTVTNTMTASVTVTAADVISTTVLKVLDSVTITGADVTKTSIEKFTITLTTTPPDVTSTLTLVVTEDIGLTITPAIVTKSSVAKVTTTVTTVTTRAVTTSTVKGTTTTTVLYTSIPKPRTTTVSQGSMVTLTISVVPKDVSTTMTSTISVAPSSTKTTTIKPKSSSIVSSTAYKTTTKKFTITQSCIPASSTPSVARRGAVLPRVNAAASTTTLTITTTDLSYTKTVTSTIPGATIIATALSTAPPKTVSIKGTTTTIVVTSAAKTVTLEQPGSTQYATITSTNKVGKTTTLKAYTTTLVVTSVATDTVVHTVMPDAITVTSFKTATDKQTIVGDQEIITITESRDTTSTIKTTVPAKTTTQVQTVTQGGGIAISTITAPLGTKTVIVKATSTAFTTTTKVVKGAKECQE